jgi:hypothetical protein
MAVQVYDVIMCKLVPGCCFEGHRNMVYDLSWSADSQVLASCSSDYTTKLWYIAAASAVHGQNCATQQSTFDAPAVGRAFCTVLHHGKFAYACQFAPAASHFCMATGAGNTPMVVAVGTEGADVSLWGVMGEFTGPVSEPQGATELVAKSTKRAGAGGQGDGAVTALVWDVANSSAEARAHVSGASFATRCRAHGTAAARPGNECLLFSGMRPTILRYATVAWCCLPQADE